MRLADHARVKDVHVGVGDVLDGNEALEVVLVVCDAEGVGLSLAHEIPCREEAHLAVDAALALNLGVLDLRCDGGDELRLVEAKVAQHERGLPVDGARAARLVDVGVLHLVLEVGVGDRRADAVGVGVEMTYDVDLADSLRHDRSS